MRAITLPWTSTFDGAERAAPFPSKMRTFSKSTSSALAVAQSPSRRAAASISLPERNKVKTGRARKNNAAAQDTACATTSPFVSSCDPKDL
ncbi:hypothetical protein [Mesorhizobium sp.]|uniref:hypothetical protein n=1 Tax=Mesorhizobium sp. TaxID=1871066 RepID=UPI00257957A7|nr:hypothetical protein [Mesorhizobium sp.]